MRNPLEGGTVQQVIGFGTSGMLVGRRPGARTPSRSGHADVFLPGAG